MEELNKQMKSITELTEMQLVKLFAETISYTYKRYTVYVNVVGDNYALDVYYDKQSDGKIYNIGRNLSSVDDVIKRIVACEKLLSAGKSPR